MAVYVIMSFDDDDDAKRFVKDVIHDGGVRNTNSDDVMYGVYVEAVNKKPRKFCDETDGHRKGKKISGWSQGKKWGWWVCSLCGLPSSGLLGPTGSGYAFNLIPVDLLIGQGLDVPSRPEHLETDFTWTVEELT